MKSIFLLFIIFNMAIAQLQTVRVGKIDKRYSHLVSKEDLISIIKEIEAIFETQLGFNVFDYSQDGKPIDILYMPPSQKKKRILKNQKKLKSLKNKIESLEVSISNKQILMNKTKTQLSNEYKMLNNDIKKLNKYISKNNSSKNISQDDYKAIKNYVSKEQKNIAMRTKDLDTKKRILNRKLASFRMKTRKYNTLIAKYNYTLRDIERLSKSYKELKGITKKSTISTYTTHTQDGTSITKKEVKSDIEKIEIYDFENLNLLKVILAHEIGHLVGVEHVDVDGALMHTYLQEGQKKKLFLTYDDIEAFRECFDPSK